MTIKIRKVCNTPECRRMRALISDYLDHALHWRIARVIEAHLAVCPPCRSFADTIEQTIRLYRERPVVDVPVAVRGHLRELLRQRHERAPKKSGCCRNGAVARTRAVTRAGEAQKPAKKR